MNFQDIQKASEGLKTCDIRGKQYVCVNERVKAFRMLCPEGTITTEILKLEDGFCLMKATVLDESGHLLADGIAYEREGSSNINKTSFIENCQTSAIGRALAFLGLGIDLSIASAEEVDNAIEQQESKRNPNLISDEQYIKIINELKRTGIGLKGILEAYSVQRLEELTKAQGDEIITKLSAKEDKK